MIVLTKYVHKGCQSYILIFIKCLDDILKNPSTTFVYMMKVNGVQKTTLEHFEFHCIKKEAFFKKSSCVFHNNNKKDSFE